MSAVQKKENNFHADLKFSDSVSESMDQYYLSALPGAERVETVTDLELQRKGIDKLVHLWDGKVVKIEEKIRRKAWPDVLLELRSRGKKLGWLFTCQADYITYVYLESRELYFIPVVLLQMAWVQNKDDWIRRYDYVEAGNVTLGGYVSKSIPVPRERLLEDLSRAMTGVVPVQTAKTKKELAY